MFPTFKQLEGKRIVLASSSPRRIEIFQRMEMDFEVIPSTFAEDFRKDNFPSPSDYCLATCNQKGESVLQSLLDSNQSVSLVVSSDTIIVCKGKILEKPRNKEDAMQMLRLFSGETIEVLTSVCMLYKVKSSTPNKRDDYKRICFVDCAQMHMATYDDDMINAYLESGHGMDHCGALSYQGAAFLMVKGISGCYYSLMGFPAARFYQELSKIVYQIC